MEELGPKGQIMAIIVKHRMQKIKFATSYTVRRESHEPINMLIGCESQKILMISSDSR